MDKATPGDSKSFIYPLCSGLLTLGGPNINQGETVVSSGTLQIGNGAGTGNLGTGNVTNNSSLVFNRTGSLSVDSTISATGSLALQGPGTVTLTGNNSYSGGTTVSVGRLVGDTTSLQRAIANNSELEFSTLAPGNSPGTLAAEGDATWNSGANYNWQVCSTNTNAAEQTAAGTGWDFLDVGGTLTLGLDTSNRFNLNLWSLSGTGPDTDGTIPGWDPNVGSTWLIARAAGGITHNGSSLLANTNYTSLFNINTSATNGAGGWIGSLPSSFQVVTLGETNNLYLYAAPGSAAVPEPGQIAASFLLLAGIGVYVWLKRRKQKGTA